VGSCARQTSRDEFKGYGLKLVNMMGGVQHERPLPKLTTNEPGMGGASIQSPERF
jgi:hypothetical protein